MAIGPIKKLHPYLTNQGRIDKLKRNINNHPYVLFNEILFKEADKNLNISLSELSTVQLFQRYGYWQSCLFSLWLATELSGDDKYKKHMYNLVEGLYKWPRHGLDYFREDHPTGGFMVHMTERNVF